MKYMGICSSYVMRVKIMLQNKIVDKVQSVFGIPYLGPQKQYGIMVF
jgi:hypothetical protein